MAALTTVYQFWIHTETIGRLGPLEYIFNTPSHHRVHHGRDPKYIDKNHAGVFITWDMLFGTYQKEEERPTYGITRPINSCNPVWANFDHYSFMIKDLIRIKGLINKIKYIFKKPGWYPDELGGYQPVKPVDKTTFQKYDTQSVSSINFYVLFKYALALGSTAFFMFNSDNFTFNESVLFTAIIILTIVNCGALFENRKWVYYTEIIRILLFSSIATYMSFVNSWDVLLLSFSVTYLIVSISWLTYAKNNRHNIAVA
jgi:hypothetical protein